MAKGTYYHIREAWKKPDKKVLRERMIEWRKTNVLTKVEKPLRLDRARSLGYKAKKFTNLEVLNSYLIGKDGVHYFYEVIMVDPERPEIKNDKTINWITKPANKARVFHGRTSAGKKARGHRKKSPEMKVRPSLRAQKRRGK